jgi:hypothetical protein
MRSLLFTAVLLAFGSLRVISAALISDPVGDTYGFGPVQIDIVSHSAVTNASGTAFVVNFLNPVSPAWAAAANSVVGMIEIDIDQNPATGAPSFANAFSPPPALSLGVEYAINLFAASPGFVGIIDATTSAHVATAPITVGPTGFVIQTSLVVATPFNYGIVVGTLLEPTDRAPNGSTPASSQTIPEPSSTYLVAGFALLIRLCRSQQLCLLRRMN